MFLNMQKKNPPAVPGDALQSALIPPFIYAGFLHQAFSTKVPKQIRKLLAQGILQIEQWDFSLGILLNDQCNTLKPLCAL